MQEVHMETADRRFINIYYDVEDYSVAHGAEGTCEQDGWYALVLGIHHACCMLQIYGR